jgi:hypothetical protein
VARRIFATNANTEIRFASTVGGTLSKGARVNPWTGVRFMARDESGRGIVHEPQGTNIRLGPHYVPRIDCGKCGTSHHIDAANGEYVGRCSECSGFLRRPTDADLDQFHEFIVWKGLHMDRDADSGGVAVAE